MTGTRVCGCGVPLIGNAIQCVTCARAAFKKIAKYAIIAGAILGLICSSIPAQYQTACRAVAAALSSC